jgi:hypothetical protein
VIPDQDRFISVRNDYNKCKVKALRACDSAAKAQGRVANNLWLAQGKNAYANPMPRPLHLRGPMHIAAANLIRGAQGGRRKRRKTRRNKKRHRRRKSTRKSKKSGTKKRRKSRGAKNKKRR